MIRTFYKKKQILFNLFETFIENPNVDEITILNNKLKKCQANGELAPIPKPFVESFLHILRKDEINLTACFQMLVTFFRWFFT